MPDLKQEHFQIFMHKFARLDKTQANKSDLIEALVNRVIIYPEKIAILINVTDKTNTPPLEQITAALETCSYCCEGGGADPYPPLNA